MAWSAPGRSWTGYHSPAKNKSGKKHRGHDAARGGGGPGHRGDGQADREQRGDGQDDRQDQPAALFGTLAPKNTMLTISRSRIEITIRHAWTTSWAASTQDGGAGVVDRRRRMPCSR